MSERERDLKRRYGISRREYNALLRTQCHRCAACKDTLGKGRARAVDHCHQTGRVRGVLCSHCNLALGHARDDSERLHALISYLEQA